MASILKKNTQIFIKEEQVILRLKQGVWLYFLLLIFEGALRKWILPFLATPLLIVRDPLAIGLIIMAWRYNIIKANAYVIGFTFFTLLSVCTALVFGHGNIMVAIYGARIFLFHFPVIFIISKVFYKADVIELGRWVLIITIPMVILIGLQFYSPQSAWVNRGIGGSTDGAGFSGAMGYFRPPGTFSFTTGNVLYFSFAACYIVYFWLAKIPVNKLLLAGATVALLAAIPLSISRTLMFSVGLTLAFAILSVAGNPKFLLRFMLFLFLGFLLILLLSNLSFFETSTAAFTKRFELASENEGGVSTSILKRVFGSLIEAFTESDNLSFWGMGIGMGTNAGAAMLTGQDVPKFLIAEEEWLRLVGEMGFVVGIGVILLRVIFSLNLVFKSFYTMRKGYLLAWLLISFAFLIIIKGQWAQPTVLGFATLSAGLILAYSKTEFESKKS